MIPKRIHLFWHGPDRDGLADTVSAWQNTNPDWDVHLWTPDEVDDTMAKAEAAAGRVYPSDRLRYVASVVRWALLNTHGGIWVDCDTQPLDPFDDTIDLEAFSAGIGSTPTPFVVGGTAGHRTWKRMLDASLDSPRGRSPSATGAALLARLAPDLRLLPITWFTEYDATGLPVPQAAGRRYCTHTWETSSQRIRERRP